MLKQYPVLSALNRRSGLEWTGGQIWGLIVFFAALYSLVFVLWPMLIRDGDFRQHPLGVFFVAVCTPMGFLWLTGGSLWITWKRARGNLAYMIGQYGAFDATAATLEADFDDQALGDLPLQMGRQWAAYVRKESCFLIPMLQIAWVYETRDGLVLNTRRGNVYNAKLTPGEHALAYYHLKRLMPWIAFGYSAALANTWCDDRADMLMLVDRAHTQGVTFASIAHPSLRSGTD